MTLPEWTGEVIEDWAPSGYTVVVHEGFPLVKVPRETTLEGRRLLLKFRGKRWAVNKIISTEGMLLLPVGTPGDPTQAES